MPYPAGQVGDKERARAKRVAVSEKHSQQHVLLDRQGASLAMDNLRYDESELCFGGDVVNQNHRLSIFADYFQFLVMDMESADDFSSLWNDEAVERMIAVGHSTVSLGTLRNVDVQVEIHVVVDLPDLPLGEYDHIAEGSFEAPTGVLAVMGCTDFLPDAYRIDIRPGDYQFLYLVRGVGSITDEWSPAGDLYILYIAPGEKRVPKLLKNWKTGMSPDFPGN